MAVIGFVRDEEMEIKAGDEKKVIKWLECYFRIAGIRPFKAKLSKNKNQQGNQSPDYYIYLRSNVNKGDTFRDIRIGSLWVKNKINEETKEVKTYMTGFIEIAFNKVNIMIQRPTKYYDDEVLNFVYEIIAFIDDKKENQNNNEYDEYDRYPSPVENYETQIDTSEDDIPF